MPDPISRRFFTSLSTGLVVGSAAGSASADDKPVSFVGPSSRRGIVCPRLSPRRVSSPRWKKPQINRLLVQDFVIYAHSDLDMVNKRCSTRSRW